MPLCYIKWKVFHRRSLKQFNYSQQNSISFFPNFQWFLLLAPLFQAWKMWLKFFDFSGFPWPWQPWVLVFQVTTENPWLPVCPIAQFQKCSLKVFSIGMETLGFMTLHAKTHCHSIIFLAPLVQHYPNI